MPNWCDNQITITGPNSVIDKIEKIVKEEVVIEVEKFVAVDRCIDCQGLPPLGLVSPSDK